jgi:hypothetical protein
MQQWVDIAKATGIQAQEGESPSLPMSNAEDQEPQEDSIQIEIEINPQEPLSSPSIDNMKTLKAIHENSQGLEKTSVHM